jgi:hypothetical protein
MAKLSEAQQFVMECLNEGGCMQEDFDGDHRLRGQCYNGARVRRSTMESLRRLDLIRFVPDDGPRGTWYPAR